MTVIFDTETTGLTDNRALRLEKQPHVWEFYGVHVDLDTGAIGADLFVRVKPPIRLDAVVTRITKMTNEKLAGLPPFSEHADAIFGFLERSDEVLAHNLRFDMDVIEIEAERLGRTIKWPDRRTCSIEATMFVAGERLNLLKLHRHLFNEDFDNWHEAKADVMALARCCIELRKREMI